MPAYIAVGAAAGLRRYINETEGLEQGMGAAKRVLAEVSGLDDDSELAKLILHMYELVLVEKSVRELLKAADEAKAASIKDII